VEREGKRTVGNLEMGVGLFDVSHQLTQSGVEFVAVTRVGP